MNYDDDEINDQFIESRDSFDEFDDEYIPSVRGILIYHVDVPMNLSQDEMFKYLEEFEERYQHIYDNLLDVGIEVQILPVRKISNAAEFGVRTEWIKFDE